ncbi:TRAP transporter substrate-binding protein [Palleronia caenipelagi]|nr:TRAP transporter substrate-binding protein [Palleronia caenipelagi]
MKMKVLSSVAALVIGLTGSAALAETVLRVGSVAPTQSPWGAWITKVAEQVETVSGGELKLQLLLDGQIGDEVTMTRQAQKGRLDMIYVTNDPLSVVMPELEIMSAPFFFDSTEQGTCVQHNHLAGILEPLMAENNLVPVTWMEVGHTNIFSSRPVRMPEDMGGLKIRVANGIIKRDFMSALGTTPSPLSVADMIPALQTGTIDAVNIPTVYGIAVGIPKLAPHVTVTQHYRLVGSLAISQRVWDKLSDEEQGWLMSVAPMGAELSEMILGAEKALLGQIAEAGVDVHYPTEEELAAWRASADGVLDASLAEIGGQSEDIRAKLEEAKAACGS